MSILVLLSLALFQAQAKPVETEAIEAAKKAVVFDMDPTLPRTAFASWLREVSGRPLETTWEVNDCGEQTGDPAVDWGRDFPMCVQAQLSLGSARDLYLLVVVGTFGKGVTPGPPRFFYGFVTEAGVPTKRLRRLGEVAAIVRTAR